MTASDKDTIVAIATAPGEGAIGIVRLSGPRAIEIADGCFRGRSLAQVPDRKLTLGWFHHDGQDLDEVLAVVMRAPRSFTGEDTVEINGHGGPLVLRRICDALKSRGARQAEPGEYTRRAFQNGRIDLTQAEAIGDLISARTDSSLQSAYFRLRGDLRGRFEEMAEGLRDVKTLLEADLDFSEDVQIEVVRVRRDLGHTRDRVVALLDGYRYGRILREGARVAICGRPNAGKSSLMNRLLGEERAIVSDTPGTTRDTIEEAINLDGLLAHLVDTAGLREAVDRVEREGTRRTEAALESADLVAVVCDGSVPVSEEDRRIVGLATARGQDSVLVLNKSDLGLDPSWNTILREGATSRVSALTGDGISDFRRSLRKRLVGSHSAGTDLITHARHADALRLAAEALGRADSAAGEGQPSEIVAFEVGEALEALGSVIGETTSQDILDRIFASFCIGK